MSVNSWGKWGDEDEIGAPNLIGSPEVLHALSLVKSGEVIALTQPSGSDALVPAHRHRGRRFMDRDAGDYALGARRVGGFAFAEDSIQISTHSGTHMDALSHVWQGDHLYNGHDAAGIRSTTGAKQLGAEKLESTLTRGVLLDIAGLRGGALSAGEEITVSDLERAFAVAETSPKRGDAVYLRTGWWESFGGTQAYFEDEPGINEACAQWLAQAGVSYVGADNYGIEVQPSEAGSMFPAHLVLIHQFGIPLIENMNLSALAGRTQPFLTVLAPVGFPGSTAAQISPLAVL